MSAGQSLASFLERVRREVDQALDRALPRPPTCPQIISEAMRYSVFAGGKRLRPVLTLAAADAVARAEVAHGASGDPASDRAGPFARKLSTEQAFEFALPAACAIELIHTYSLVHDDLPAMDNDTLRRGRPTLHVVYGDGIAILAGDGLQTAAFALLAREPRRDDEAIVRRKLRVLGVVGEAAGAIGMVGGQAIDLEAAGQVRGRSVALDHDALRDMHARKTGALIRASAIVGGIMAGATEPMIDGLGTFATELGLAFQIVDDILDVEGNAAELGKTAGKDAAGTKLTYPLLFGIERSRTMAAECVTRAREALGAAGLVEGWLPAIADWVVSRRN